ncbi:MAG: sulfurtransferase [Acidimicrobiales bacterium]|nr:sulfurtransferase [Acidimicrobiales bacterium]
MRPLVSTEWLAQNIEDPQLRILECSVNLRSGPEGYTPASMRQIWADDHIPNSAYADLTFDLSDPRSDLRFTMPTAERFTSAMEDLGVGTGTRVVLYDRRFTMWATRVWWMLKTFGFDNCAVLDGGWTSWVADGFATTSDPAPTRASTTFHAEPRPELIADLERTKAALNDGTCIINALSGSNHDGTDASYGRRGHLPGAGNVYAVDLLDPESHRYLPIDQLAELLGDATRTSGPIITYCGGGIAATSDAFVLSALLGKNDVSVYDGSLSEWLLDPNRPLEV